MPGTFRLRGVSYSPITVLLSLLGLLIAMWLCSFCATVWAYGLTQGVYYPNASIQSQVQLAGQVSMLTALLSFLTLIGPVVRARKMGYLKAALIVGFGTEVLLALRSILSWQFIGVPASPSTLFSEYNWLTFILEVGPLVSLSAVLLTSAVLWVARRLPAAGKSN